MNALKIGVLGSGDVAHRISRTVSAMQEIELYSVASLHYENAQKLAREFSYQKVCKSYDEVINDPCVDVVYIGLLHPLHYAYALRCLECNKPVLCEKPFTMNRYQAKFLIDAFEEKGLFLGEALWTRFLPVRKRINDILAAGALGEIKLVDVNMICNIAHLDRMVNPEKGGGALLDLGVYALNFVDMFWGSDVCETRTLCTMRPNGIDDSEAVIMQYPDGKLAVCKISMSGCGNPGGAIYGAKGHIEVNDVMNLGSVKVFDADNTLIEAFSLENGRTGYEYEFLACREALARGKTEFDEMPHSATLTLMRQYDKLRDAWGLSIPWSTAFESNMDLVT